MTLFSKISHRAINEGEEVQGSEIREGIFELIRTKHPDFGREDHISNDELNEWRRLYLTSLIQQ